MDPKDFSTELSDLEVKLERLRALYDLHFQGIERLPPTVPRKEVDRKIYMLRKELPRNAATRFRFQQLVQRYTVYTTLWSRTARQIEEGTYRRDLMRARKKREQARQERQDRAMGFDVLDLDTIEFEDLTQTLAGHRQLPPVSIIPPKETRATPIKPPALPNARSPFTRKIR